MLRQKLKSTIDTIERQIQDKHPNHAIYRSRMHSLASSVCPFARLQTSRWARTLPGCTFLGDALVEKVRLQNKLPEHVAKKSNWSDTAGEVELQETGRAFTYITLRAIERLATKQFILHGMAELSDRNRF